MADILSTDEGIPSPQMGGAPAGSANALAAREARKNTKYEEFFAAKAKNLVKGVGHVSNNGVPLSDVSHGGEIMTRSHDTIMKTRAATIDGAWNTDDVVGGISQDFWGHPQCRRWMYHGVEGTRWSGRTSPPETWVFRALRTVWCLSTCLRLRA